MSSLTCNNALEILRRILLLNVSHETVEKLVCFYLRNREAIKKHLPNPDDDVVYAQLEDNTRLVALLDVAGDCLDMVKQDYEQYHRRYVRYVYRSENSDIVAAISKSTGITNDVLSGMAFAYKPEDILDFVYKRASPYLWEKLGS